MLRDKPLAAGSGRQPLTAPLEDRHLHHGRLARSHRRAPKMTVGRFSLTLAATHAGVRCALYSSTMASSFHELGEAALDDLTN